MKSTLIMSCYALITRVYIIIIFKFDEQKLLQYKCTPQIKNIFLIKLICQLF